MIDRIARELGAPIVKRIVAPGGANPAHLAILGVLHEVIEQTYLAP